MKTSTSIRLSYLAPDDVLELFDAIIGSSAQQLRSRELFEAAVMTPQQSAFGEDAYPTIEKKAWAYLRGLTKNHAFAEGNRRIAWATMRAFLSANNLTLDVPATIAEAIVILIATDDLDFSDFE